MPQPAVLLMTDIVDSVRLLQALGDTAYATLFAAHDAIVRRLAFEHHGREINRSDGVLMRFRSVEGAAAFALGYHADLERVAPDLLARVGIHAGEVDLREGDERRATAATLLPGRSVPMTARVMGLASGRQTLLTAAAMEALPRSNHRWASHGFWSLKGIVDPIELFEIGDAQVVFAPPRDGPKAYGVRQRNGLWLPRREIPHSLPAERDRFIGRGAGLNTLASLIDGDARLISVVGPGGVGKTRLVQRFGWRRLGDFDGGVWYCDLSQATTCDGLLSAVAQGLALQLGASPPIEQIGAAIAQRGPCVVILDNFEHLTRFARETLGAWLDAAGHARFLVTSRDVLGLAGETVLRLASLERREGIDLFVERARAADGAGDEVRTSGRSPVYDADVLDALVRLLDGIPLAIELAAARLRIMDPPTLLKRMRERFKVLTAGPNRVGRHATLRATLDWSWDLLSASERSALAQASVFEGGFGLDAFESVAAVDDPIDILQSLVDKSLVQQSRASRFDLLVSVKEYAGEHLATAGRFDGSGPDARDAVYERHAAHFASIDEDAATADRCIEIDNLVAALHRGVALADADVASRLLVNCWAALKQCGPYRTGESLAAEVRAMPELGGAALARVDYVAGIAAQNMGKGADAERCFRHGIVVARDSGSAFEQVRLSCALGELEFTLGDGDEAMRLLDEANAMSQAIGDVGLRCVVLNALGQHAQSRDDNAAALARFGEALALAEQHDYRRWAAAMLGNMGAAFYGLRDLDAAKDHYVRCLATADLSGDLRWIGNTRSNLGLLLSDQGNHTDALVEFDEALRIARQLGHLRLECVVHWNIGISMAAQARHDEALVHYRAARALAIGLDDQRSAALLDDDIARHVAARDQLLMMTGSVSVQSAQGNESFNRHCA